MAQRKQRVTITIDNELVEAGNRAVAAGEADSISAWINAALSEQARREQKLKYLDEAIADYEAECGVITDEEMMAIQRKVRENAIVVRGGRIYKPTQT